MKMEKKRYVVIEINENNNMSICGYQCSESFFKNKNHAGVLLDMVKIARGRTSKFFIKEIIIKSE